MAVTGFLAGQSGMALDVVDCDAPGGFRGIGVTPRYVPEGYRFVVGLSWTHRHAEAFFRPDRFSRELVQDIGEGVMGDPSGWRGFVADAQQDGVDVEVKLDGNYVEAVQAPEALDWRTADYWRTLEIVCFTSIDRGPTGSAGTRRTALERASWVCLGLVLSGLTLERVETIGGMEEGAALLALGTRFERSQVNRMRCIHHFGWTCQVCGFDFETAYGALGMSFIEVHHLTPVSEMGGTGIVDPINDLIPVCSNCHCMIHRNQTARSPSEIREALRSARDK